MKSVNRETVTSMPSEYKAWPLKGCHRIRAEPRLLRKRNRVYGSFLEPTAMLKVIFLIIHCNLAKPVKSYPGIIVLQHLTVPRQMILHNGRCAG